MPDNVGREKRVPLHLPVEVKGTDASGRTFIEGSRSINISGGGICFESDRALPIGARVDLRIVLPPGLQRHFGGRPTYRVRAVVCRVEHFEGITHSRIGARFIAPLD